MKNIVIIENLRSAYNVWNIVRTADALWRDIVISWYSASPLSNPKVHKSALWAENSVNIKEFREPNDALSYAREAGYILVSAEITSRSTSLVDFSKNYFWNSSSPLAVIVWNELEWVLATTMNVSDHIVHIPMNGLKASLNVWQAAAIFMWELSAKL